jgi:hypothetical protein
MRTIILLFTVLFCFKMGFGQPMKISKVIDTLKIDTRLDSITFNKILKKEFNAVINSSGKTTIGNYASADIKDGHVAFNATKNFNNGNMLSFNVNGGITNGFFAVFNQTKINNNVGVDFKYNVRLNSSSLSFHTDEISKLLNKLNNADAEFELSNTIHKHDSILIQKKLSLITVEINNFNSQLNRVDLSAEQKANLEYQLALKNIQQDSLQFKLQTFVPANEATENSNKKRKKDKTDAITNFEYTGIFFHWLSFGGGFQNNNFNQLKPNFSTLDSQIVKQNYTTWNATIEYNLYKWNQYSKPTLYLLIGTKFSIDDNFSDLSKVELNDTQTFGDSINQRSITKKINAYKGSYKTNLLSCKLYIDFYRFFFKNDAAIHFYPEVNFKQHDQSLYNAGIGLLYSFKDAKDKENKAKLHAELYFKLSDLSNNGKSDLSVLQRNELGLRLSIPVSFFNL